MTSERMSRALVGPTASATGGLAYRCQIMRRPAMRTSHGNSWNMSRRTISSWSRAGSRPAMRSLIPKRRGTPTRIGKRSYFVFVMAVAVTVPSAF
ncbi:hypothetical protein GCM10022255_003480 [Dactylosporangium darangshiense]|uniref:Uncharacterized protein n=1 Tax=Dactylosporangium darangshiense TaxID=579108 RepID=A0ABP8CUP7_9ACTN